MVFLEVFAPAGSRAEKGVTPRMISLFATVAPEAENLEKDHVAIVWLMCG